MQWRASLKGNPSDLMLLHQALSNGDVVIERQDDSFWIAGPALVDLHSAQDAFDRAKELLPLVNGVGRVIEPMFVPVSLLGQVSDGGPLHQVFAEFHMSGRGRLYFGEESGVAARIAARVTSDASYEEVINLIGDAEELNWFVLYKVFELLRSDAGGEQAFRQRSGITKDRLSAFTGSANNRSISGWEARHAVDQSTKPPRCSMSLREAQVLILSIVRDW